MAGRDDFYADGSYTVEAAFLVPMILGIVFAWIFMIFYLHDQVVICGLMQEAAVSEREVLYTGDEKGRGTETDGEESFVTSLENGTERGIQDRIQSYLWLVRSESVQRKKGPLRTKLVFRGTAAWNIPIMHGFLGDMTCRVTAQTGNVRPVTLLRAGLHRQTEEQENDGTENHVGGEDGTIAGDGNESAGEGN